MRRKIDRQLAKWAQDQDTRPLLIRGARRVGKTHALKKLGSELFGTNFAYCDFQTNPEQLSAIFSGTTDIARIVSELSLFLRTPIDENTLIALDEIQLCERALNSLRFFAQSNYRVIATGSQLGVTMRKRSLPFPSDVDQIVLCPMDFEEFLWACSEDVMVQGIRKAYQERRKFLLHEEALKRYFEYSVVGGMPLAVSEFVHAHSFPQVRSFQAEIDNTYVADIALYAPSDSVVHTQAVWASIARQLARETTRKFKYADVESGGRERKYRMPLAWLEAVGLVSLNYQTNECTAPLVARGGGSFFKVYMADTGLMFYKLNLSAEMYLDKIQRLALSARFRGALAENYVMQALVANRLEPFYWSAGGTRQGEVEFVLQSRTGSIVPLEVKSGDRVSSASLRNYQKKIKASCVLRLSTKNFGFEDGVFSVPLYAAFCLDDQAISSL